MPSLIEEVETFIRSTESAPSAAEHVAENAAGFTERVFTSAAGELTAGMDTAAGEATLAAGSAFGRIAAIGNMFAILQAALLIHDWFDKIYRVTNSWPGPFNKIAKVLLAMSFPVQSAVEIAGNKILELLPHAIHDQVQLTHWANSVGAAAVKATPVIVPAPPQVTLGNPHHYATIHDIQHIETQIQQLQHALGIAEQPHAVPQQVWDQIHHLERLNALTSARIDVLDHAIARLAADISSVGHEFNTLNGELGNLRAISVNVTDLVQAQQQQLTTLTHLYNHTDQTVHTQGRQIAQLSPLALLLQPGINGLRTLRKLEDTPCMCPKFAGIPNELGTALAMVEFVENG